MNGLLSVVAAMAIVVVVVAGLCSVVVFLGDNEGPIRVALEWCKSHIGHQHDGPPFLTTGEYGREVAGATPREVIVWRTCKKDGQTYTERRLETADEFEARTKSEKSS